MKKGRYGTTRTAAIALIFVIAASFNPTFVDALDPEDIAWSSDTRLTWNEALDVSPSIMQAVDGSIWVVWSSDREHSYNDLYYAISCDYGENWLNYSLTSDLEFWDTNPSIIQARDDSIWMVWGRTKITTPATYDIYYSYSADYGENWSPAKNITDPSTRDEDPSIMEDAYGRIWVAWRRRVEGNSEIFYKYSSDHGVSWSPDKQLTNHTGIDKASSIMQAVDGSIWIAWASHRNITGETVDFEIFYKYTYDYGEHWSPDTLLTNQTGYDDSPHIIQARDGSIFVFWTSDRLQPSDSMYDLFYEISEDLGQTWSKPLGERGTQLTTYPKTGGEQDVGPSAANIDDGRIWVIWHSNRVTKKHVEFEVFYKNSSVIPIHDVAITNVTPSKNILYVGKDEIFNVSVVAENQGTENETFEVMCYANSTLIGSQTITLANGTSQTLLFSCNTSDLATAKYIISANASVVEGEIKANTADNTFIDATVHVKILGDVNGDDKVDASDLSDLNEAYGSEPGDPNWNSNCDFNGDDRVDALDLFDVSKNFGKS